MPTSTSCPALFPRSKGYRPAGPWTRLSGGWARLIQDRFGSVRMVVVGGRTMSQRLLAAADVAFDLDGRLVKSRDGRGLA